MEIVEIPVLDRVDEMPFDNGTTVSVCVVNVSDYYQTNLFVKIE